MNQRTLVWVELEVEAFTAFKDKDGEPHVKARKFDKTDAEAIAARCKEIDLDADDMYVVSARTLTELNIHRKEVS
jgi:hypothetical protein